MEYKNTAEVPKDLQQDNLETVTNENGEEIPKERPKKFLRNS